MALSSRSFLLIVLIALIFFSARAHAFGAGSELTEDLSCELTC